MKKVTILVITLLTVNGLAGCAGRVDTCMVNIKNPNKKPTNKVFEMLNITNNGNKL
ncbi:MAG: hypothetical protein CG439_2566 [Methylococcaceae bacterium NSP1-2]|nr:hypothetical protein [Methylococcaceae bacterium]OYV15519.1 MAG: hypothetical protein CG439_2566 [Methylococcaceae bacterium NSP1-2]